MGNLINIEIESIDINLLQEQKLSLITIKGLTPEQHLAIDGILNLLDTITDRYYNYKD